MLLHHCSAYGLREQAPPPGHDPTNPRSYKGWRPVFNLAEESPVASSLRRVCWREPQCLTHGTKVVWSVQTRGSGQREAQSGDQARREPRVV